jgi:hypothetical protein
MVVRIASLALETMDGLRWLLPAILAAVVLAVVCLDGHLIWRGTGRRERASAGQWIADNFWILVGSLLAIYVVWHYPHDPW